MMIGILNHSLMASIHFHYTLHRIRISRDTRATSLESRLLQQLITIREEVIYKIFLYLHKSYDAQDRGCCLDILVAQGMAPQALWLILRYWDHLTMVARAGGCFGYPFKGKHGVTQVDLLFPTIFNVVVGTFIRNWVTMVAEMDGIDETGIEGFGRDIQWLAAYFYADNIIIVESQENQIQQDFNVLIYLFEWFGMCTNVGKMVSIVCQTYRAIGGHSTYTYFLNMMVEALDYQ